jgi:DNA (cytosine-5)-methyltransferase 1
MDSAACFTLRTRTVFHYLAKKNNLQPYIDYIYGRIKRDELYQYVPQRILDTVINKKIGQDTMEDIISRINELAKGGKVDLIIGGPPCQAYSLIGRAGTFRE